jgi:hypothetical protein
MAAHATFATSCELWMPGKGHAPWPTSAACPWRTSVSLPSCGAAPDWCHACFLFLQEGRAENMEEEGTMQLVMREQTITAKRKTTEAGTNGQLPQEGEAAEECRPAKVCRFCGSSAHGVSQEGWHHSACPNRICNRCMKPRSVQVSQQKHVRNSCPFAQDSNRAPFDMTDGNIYCIRCGLPEAQSGDGGASSPVTAERPKSSGCNGGATCTKPDDLSLEASLLDQTPWLPDDQKSINLGQEIRWFCNYSDEVRFPNPTPCPRSKSNSLTPRNPSSLTQPERNKDRLEEVWLCLQRIAAQAAVSSGMEFKVQCRSPKPP